MNINPKISFEVKANLFEFKPEFKNNLTGVYPVNQVPSCYPCFSIPLPIATDPITMVFSGFFSCLSVIVMGCLSFFSKEDKKEIIASEQEKSIPEQLRKLQIENPTVDKKPYCVNCTSVFMSLLYVVAFVLLILLFI